MEEAILFFFLLGITGGLLLAEEKASECLPLTKTFKCSFFFL